MYAAEDFTPTAQGTFLDISTTANGTISRIERIRVQNNGNILIGTTTDAGQKLQVNGTASISGNVGIGGTGAARLGVYGAIPANTYMLIDNAGAGINYFAANSFHEFQTAGSIKFTIKSNTINIRSIPTSAAGLVSGDIYSNAGILTIVP